MVQMVFTSCVGYCETVLLIEWFRLCLLPVWPMVKQCCWSNGSGGVYFLCGLLWNSVAYRMVQMVFTSFVAHGETVLLIEWFRWCLLPVWLTLKQCCWLNVLDGVRFLCGLWWKSVADRMVQVVFTSCVAYCETALLIVCFRLYLLPAWAMAR